MITTLLFYFYLIGAFIATICAVYEYTRLEKNGDIKNSEFGAMFIPAIVSSWFYVYSFVKCNYFNK